LERIAFLKALKGSSSQCDRRPKQEQPCACTLSRIVSVIRVYFWLFQNMGSQYRPELDGVRAFCIIFTILHHVPGRPWFIDGGVGVDAFFPLSGWLITWLLLEEERASGAVNLGSFYIRRVFRIVPLYYLTIFVYAAAALSVYVATKDIAKLDELRDVAPYLFSFNSEYRPDDAGVVFGHAWTLGIEEKFYLLWPLLIALIGRSSFRTGAVALFFIGVLFALCGVNDYILRGYFGLSVGAGLALWVNRSPALMLQLKRMPLAWPALCAALVIYVGLVTMPNVLWHFGLSVSFAVLIVSVWFCRDQGLARFLNLAPFVWLGTLTYAIYLLQTLGINVAQGALNKLHFPATYLSIFVLAYLISIIAAWLVHISIEQPAINVGRRLARRRGSWPVQA
jgi:peptidoglycan/LPS O-acetylase OafA/YrhL